eukprot:s4354_g1.t1
MTMGDHFFHQGLSELREEAAQQAGQIRFHKKGCCLSTLIVTVTSKLLVLDAEYSIVNARMPSPCVDNLENMTFVAPSGLRPVSPTPRPENSVTHGAQLEPQRAELICEAIHEVAERTAKALLPTIENRLANFEALLEQGLRVPKAQGPQTAEISEAAKLIAETVSTLQERLRSLERRMEAMAPSPFFPRDEQTNETKDAVQPKTMRDVSVGSGRSVRCLPYTPFKIHFSHLVSPLAAAQDAPFRFASAMDPELPTPASSLGGSPPGDTGGAGESRASLEAETARDGDGLDGAGLPGPAAPAAMLRAKALAKMAMEDLRPETPSRGLAASHVQKLREECQAARSRIQANVSSVSKVFEITRSLESHIVNLEDCKNRVKQKRNSRWSDLAVCQKRLEMLGRLDWFHESKPEKASKSGKAASKSPHVSRGNLVEALEIEQESLLVLRRELGSWLLEVDPLIEVIIDLRKRLQQEASDRRAAMRKDHVTLTQQDGSEREDADGSSFRSFDDRNFWVKKAQSLEESAQQLLQKAFSTIQWTDLECSQANQCVSQCLSRCSAEDQRLRRQLDAQLRDLDFAISCADWTISKPENRAETASSQVQRAHVLLHELTATKKHLKCLVRKCKKDLQILESCRNTTAHTLASLTNCKRCRQEKSEKVTPDEADEAKTQCGFGETYETPPEMFDPRIDVGTEFLGGGFSHVFIIFYPQSWIIQNGPIDLGILGFSDLPVLR